MGRRCSPSCARLREPIPSNRFRNLMAPPDVVESVLMSTLTEIEAAAAKLPGTQKEALVEYTSALLRRERTARPPQNDLAEFSGALRLAEDPLAWQRRVRGEWE